MALAGCITHLAPKVRSLLCVLIFTGMNRICWLRIAREFLYSYFARPPITWGGYSSFLSIEPLSLIPLVQPSSRTCTIDATKIANSIIKEIRKRATIWHQISGGVERAAVRSGKTIKKRRLFVKVSTERPLSSGKRITITGTWEHTDAMKKIRKVNIIWS